ALLQLVEVVLLFLCILLNFLHYFSSLVLNGANFATTITAHSTSLLVRRSCHQSTYRKFHTPSAQFHAPFGWR
ncbi:hypothetical protein N4Q70_20160, partial [Salmonella enterica subsp. enterica serovar Weltevreden]|uniref:hypothetical protein n=1 Tax=Salmonella enterica TaxID=28901 RepID=UPI003733113E